MINKSFNCWWPVWLAVPAIVLTAWAVDDLPAPTPQQVDQMQARFAREESKLELEMLELQLQFKDGTMAPEQYQKAMLGWARDRQNRIKDQNDLAALLDRLRPVTAEPEPERAPPSSPEDAALREVEGKVGDILKSIREEAASALEAQKKISQWGDTPEGAALRRRLEELQNAVAATHSKDMVSMTLDEPDHPTPAQLKALDLQEEILGKWLALKIEVEAAGGDSVLLQERIAMEESFFRPRREALEDCFRNISKEELQNRIADLKNRTR